MDKAQATEIQGHLLAAGDAIDKASAVIVELDTEDRAMFAGPLGKLVSCLHYEMLALIYARHPELRPFEDEEAVINSDLRWEDVTLPASASETELDAIIFSVLTSRLQKTAMVIAKAMKHCDKRALPVSAEIVGARIRALAESYRIESAGDLRKWRYSEVRLND
jgi:Protein of unknown function